MAFPPHPFQQHRQQPAPKLIKDIYGNMDSQIPAPAAFFNCTSLPDQTHHPPYVPPFQVMGLEAAPVGQGGGGGLELQWNYGLEPKKENLKEQDFLENRANNNANSNSQMSSVDFLQARSVSTGLGLSLDNNHSNGRLASSGESGFLGAVADEIYRELQRQDAEFSRYMKIQGDRARKAILEKVQAQQLQTLSYVEERVQQKIHEKEAEVENINKKNMELEMRLEQLALEATAWQQRAHYNETIINSLKFKLQQVLTQNRDSKEGCGDSEVDDTASCSNGRPIDFHLLRKDGTDMTEFMSCSACRFNKVCVLLLPCKHLCLCKECDSKISNCPLCQTPKYIGLEVYL